MHKVALCYNAPDSNPPLTDLVVPSSSNVNFAKATGSCFGRPLKLSFFPSPTNNTTTNTRNIIKPPFQSKVRTISPSSISYASERARSARVAYARVRAPKHRSRALPHSFRMSTKYRDRHHQIIELADTVQNKLLTALTCRRAGACLQGTSSRLQQPTSSFGRAHHIEARHHHFRSLNALRTSSLALSQACCCVLVSLVAAATSST